MDITYLEAEFGTMNATVTTPLHKSDKGVILRVTGVDDLPEYFEAHFANSKNGTAVTVLGHDCEAVIPDQLLETGLPVYCWIYVTNEITGRTVYTVTIPVVQRADASEVSPTPEQADIITQLRGQIDNANQTAQITGYVNSLIAPLQAKVTEIADKQLPTVPVQWPQIQAVNTTPYMGGLYCNGFGNNIVF
jgi:hypothetical protein